MLSVLASFLAFGTLSIAAFGVGRPLLRWLGVANDDPLSAIVFSIGLGLTAAGLVLMALGLIGMIYVPPLAVLSTVACCWGLVEIGNLCLRSVGRVPEGFRWLRPDELELSFDPPWTFAPRWLLAAVLTAAVAVCIGSLLAAVTPPADGAACGTIDSAQRFLTEHSVPADRAARPLLIDMWCLWAVALEGSVCAQLVPWGLGLLLALATVALATPVLGRPWAWLAGALVVLTPAVNHEMSLPTESVALTAFCVLTLAAWWQAVIHGEDRRWFAVAGLMAGGALGIHYAAALLMLTLAITWAWTVCRRVEQRRFLLQGGAVAELIAAGVGVLFSLPVTSLAMKPACISAATLPDCLGITVLAAVPGVLLIRRLRGLGVVLSTALIYLVLAGLLTGDRRLLFPAVPLLSIAAVWVWIELQRFPPVARTVAIAAFTILLACSTATSLIRVFDAFANQEDGRALTAAGPPGFNVVGTLRVP
jgi:hypothetical protein